MNQEQYFQKLRDKFEHALELMKRKNHDYAGEDDPFKNFRAAEMLGLTVEEGILVRMSDKLARVSNLIRTHENDNRKGQDISVSEESIEDTLIDLMNYANILAVYFLYGEERLKLFSEEKKSLECPQHDCNKANCNDMKHY